MISIIIPVCNQHDMTYECISQVLKYTTDCEIILVDNGSEPPIKPPFSGFIETRIIRNEENKGFPKAVNQGIKEAKGDIIILLNNDVIVTEGWAYKLARQLGIVDITGFGSNFSQYISGKDIYSIVGPVTNYAAGVQAIEANYQSIDEMEKFAGQIAEEYEGDITDVNFVIGFCMAFKKSLYDELGEFDESMWPCSGEEIDFCFRAREKGYKIGIVNEVFLHHEGSITFRKMQDQGKVDCRTLFAETDKHLTEKWGADFWHRQLVKDKASYLIMAPEYQHNSAGVRALYRLKDELIARGYKARMVQKCFASNNDIVVYPEIVSGNPLGGKTVARWVLNKPGLLGGEQSYDENELIFTWDKKYYDTHILTIPVIEDFFINEGLPRKGGCFWVGKGGSVPRIHETDGLIEITYDWPKTRQELATLLNEKEVFYTYDNNTSLITEAKACGCKVVVIGEELKNDFDENIKHWESQLEEFIRLTQGYAQKTDDSIRLAIGVPCSFPMIPSSFFHSYALMNKPAHIYIYENNGHIDDLRNNIVERALYEGATHLIMMDVDQVYPVETINKLLAHNLPVVGCRVHRRYPPFDSLMLRLEKVDENTNAYISVDEWKEGELVEVDATGGGCVMFNMDVFRALKYPWYETKIQENGRVLGEDIHLCQKIQQAGYKIFVDSSLEVGHLATMIVNGATNRLYRCAKSEQQKDNMSKALKIDEVA